MIELKHKLYVICAILFLGIVGGLLFAIGIELKNNERVKYCKKQTGIATDKCNLNDFHKSEEVSDLYIAGSVFAGLTIGLLAFLITQWS